MREIRAINVRPKTVISEHFGAQGGHETWEGGALVGERGAHRCQPALPAFLLSLPAEPSGILHWEPPIPTFIVWSHTATIRLGDVTMSPHCQIRLLVGLLVCIALKIIYYHELKIPPKTWNWTVDTGHG